MDWTHTQTTSLGDVEIGPVIGVLALLRYKRSVERARYAEYDERFGVLIELPDKKKAGVTANVQVKDIRR